MLNISKDKNKGIILNLDLNGNILRIIRNDLTDIFLIIPNQNIQKILPIIEDNDWDYILSNIINEGSILNLEYNLPSSKIYHYTLALKFCLILHNDEIELIGSLTSEKSDKHFFGELMAINNRQINHLRSLAKDISINERIKVKEEFIEDLMRLNNETINKERQLAELNRELYSKIEEIEILRKLLPICPCCNELKKEEDYFLVTKNYIKNHIRESDKKYYCEDCKNKK